MKPIYILCMAFFLLSCGSQKSSFVSENQFVSVKTSDTIFIEKTQGISDTIFIKVPEIQTLKPGCDSICQVQIENILAQISSEKTSGQNRAGFYFDKYKKQLVLYNELKEQFNSYKSNIQFITKEVELVKIEKIPVRYVPRWVSYLAIFGAFSILVFVGYIIKKIQKIKEFKNENT